jgi:hypothetical protein
VAEGGRSVTKALSLDREAEEAQVAKAAGGGQALWAFQLRRSVTEALSLEREAGTSWRAGGRPGGHGGGSVVEARAGGTRGRAAIAASAAACSRLAAVARAAQAASRAAVAVELVRARAVTSTRWAWRRRQQQHQSGEGAAPHSASRGGVSWRGVTRQFLAWRDAAFPWLAASFFPRPPWSASALVCQVVD